MISVITSTGEMLPELFQFTTERVAMEQGSETGRKKMIERRQENR